MRLSGGLVVLRKEISALAEAKKPLDRGAWKIRFKAVGRICGKGKKIPKFAGETRTLPYAKAVRVRISRLRQRAMPSKPKRRGDSAAYPLHAQVQGHSPNTTFC